MSTWEEWAKSVNEKLAAIEQTLKWFQARIDTAFEKIDKLQNELVETFFVERMQALIVEELKSQDKTQKQIAQELPDFSTHPMVWHAFYRVWERFEKNKVIAPISQGRGHPRLWHLTIRKEVADRE